MSAALLLALLLTAAFAGYAPRRAPMLPPRTATALLTIGALITTGVPVLVLGLAAATALAQLPPVAALGEWSRPDLRHSDPLPIWLAAGCGALLLTAATLGSRAALRRAIGLARLHRYCRQLQPVAPGQQVVVVRSDQPQAYATPAGGGRIVVTTGLLSALHADEQRVLFAHEAAHLRYRHAWWVLLVELCAAANPMLRAVARATVQATERWADEYAASRVGDRELAARAVARAALHITAATSHRHPAPAATGGEIPQRVRALLAPPAPPRRLLTAGLALLLAAGLVSAATVQRRADAYFDLASTERTTGSHTAAVALHDQDSPRLP